MSCVRNLSMYGWISTVICGIICCSLSATTNRYPLALFFSDLCAPGSTQDDGVSASCNAYSGTYDDQFGVDDICFGGGGYPKYLIGSYFPNKVYWINPAEGVCFTGSAPTSTEVADANAAAALGNSFYRPLLPSTVYVQDKNYYCIPWDAKVGSAYVLMTTDSSTPGIQSYCELYGSAVYPNPGNGFNTNIVDTGGFVPVETPPVSNCGSYNDGAKQFISAGQAAIAAACFSAFAAVLGLVGAFMLANKSGETFRKMIQCASGACYIIMMICFFVYWNRAAANPDKNPYFYWANILQNGCLAGYQNWGVGGYFPVYLIGGYFSSSIALIIGASQGGINLSTQFCNNRCCCPCCFILEDVVTTTTATTVGSSRVEIKGNGGVVGVQV